MTCLSDEIRRQRGASPWRPIGEAPRDGRLVDLWGVVHDPATTAPVRFGTLLPGRWVNCCWRWGHDGHTDVGYVGPGVQAWWHILDSYSYRIWPTHFMAIPPGPGA